MLSIGWILFVATATGVFFENVRGSISGDHYEIVLQDYLRWNYTYMNPKCTFAGGGRNPCQDIRICNFAVASLAMRGWPTLCGWVASTVPKVCCGLPLVLGPTLIKKVDEEKARNRRCGTITWQPNLSETENTFFQILKALPPVDISEPDNFDPPLDLSVETMVSPVGGRLSRQGEFPWMVSIRKRGNHLCGGALIDRSHILSAAHCFVNNSRKPDRNDYTVHVGDIHVDQGEQFYVKKIVIYPEYRPQFRYHDLAILSLSEEILEPHFAHICLPSSDLDMMDLTGKNTTVLGWVDTSIGDKSTPVLQIVDDIPVMSNHECGEVYKEIAWNVLPKGLTDDFMCVGIEEGGKDTCKMAIGGPLMYKNNYMKLPSHHPDIPWTIVGVLSKCQPGLPRVYTRVSSYKDWITKVINE